MAEQGEIDDTEKPTVKSTSHLDELAVRLGLELPTIRSSQRATSAEQQRLTKRLQSINSSDTSIVVFGSLARLEWTSGSDVDWTLLVDGVVDPQHIAVTHQIQNALSDAGAGGPGPEKVFGNMAISHAIVHFIGGEEDTNKNITQRILMLLESCPLGHSEAHERVTRSVINRYVIEDRGLSKGSGPERVPRFLLNDIVRYWRTIAVDYAYKQRDRQGKGMPLRNFKLRMSRKLIFVAGLLACFSCSTDEVKAGNEDQRQHLVQERLHDLVGATPIDILCQGIKQYGVDDALALELLSCYESFLAVLADEEKRRALQDLQVDEIDGNPVSDETRGIARRFDNALQNMFFETDLLVPLIKKYGVF